MRRRLDTPEQRAFWAVVDRIGPGTGRPIGDPWLDSTKDLSPSLVTGRSGLGMTRQSWARLGKARRKA